LARVDKTSPADIPVSKLGIKISKARMTPSIYPINRNLQYHPSNFWAPVVSYDALDWNSISSNPPEASDWNSNDFVAPDWNSNDFVAPDWNSNDFIAPDWNSNDFVDPTWNSFTSNPTELEDSSPSIDEGQSFLHILPFVILYPLLILIVCGLLALLLRSNRTLPNIPVVPSTNSNVATVNPTVPQQENESEATLKARRNIVIEILFPYQGNNTKVSIASNTPFNSSSPNF
jgi:hypothetical protein